MIDLTKKDVAGLFEDYLTKESLFLEKEVLQSNYTPDNIPHREEQITYIAKILAPSLRLNKPSNLFLYGKTGTGKTLSVRHTTDQIMEVSKKNKIPVRVFYINCKLKKVADTEYRLIAHLAREFGKDVPPTGLPTDEVYRIFYSAIDNDKQVLLLVLDEIDQLVKKAGDEILYNLTRLNSELKNAQISLIGISNDLVFTDNLDPRVKSSLSEEELVFPPYNALQIQDILNQRAKSAFVPGSLTAGVIEKCAAYAAKEHGDARRALELLRIAGEIAERDDKDKVEIEHLDLAEEKIERDRIVDIVTTQPKQFQAVLYSIYAISESKRNNISTGEVYDVYKTICNRTALRPLTQRRLSDILAELDMLGIINAKVISKGRYGRTKEISLATQSNIEPKIKSILRNDLGLA